MIKKILLVVLATLSIGVGTSIVFAQETNQIELTPLEYAIAFSSFPASGVFYSTSGYIKNIRRALASEKVQIEWPRLLKSVGLGSLIGVVAFIWSAYSGDTLTPLTTIKLYVTQVGVNTAAVLFVDKWLLGKAKKQ